MAVLTRDFALDRGSDLALIDEIRSVTWAELDLRVNRLVNGLRDLGLSTGDTVAVVAGNQCEWFEIAQACAHGGWTYVPVNWHWVADELAYVFNDAQAKVVLVDSRYEGPVAEALKDDRSQSVQHVVGIQCGARAAVRNNAHFVEHLLQAQVMLSHSIKCSVGQCFIPLVPRVDQKECAVLCRMAWG